MTGCLEGDHHLTEDVALSLPGSGVADPHRARPGIPGKMVELALRELSATVDGIHDLEVGRVAGDCAHEPVPPEPGLLDVPAGEERREGERGVPQPAVPVVPVALAAHVLGEARRRRGDDPSPQLVGEQPQHEERAGDGVGGRAIDAAVARPVLEDLGRDAQRPLDVDRLRHRRPRGHPGRRELEPLTGAHGEGVAVVAVLGAREPVPAQDEHVGAGDGPDDGSAVLVGGARHPRQDRPVARAHDPLVSHRHLAVEPFDDPEDVGPAVTERHEVGDADPAGVGLVGRVEDEGVAAVGARRAGRARWAEEPPAVLRRPEQGGEARGGVEAGEAEPVHRPRAADEGGAFGVAQQRVVRDRRRHVRDRRRHVATVAPWTGRQVNATATDEGVVGGPA